jgi:hypothetical protein
MKSYSRIILCLSALVLVAGCASTKITEHEIYVMDNIPRPEHILVYDFAATPADVPAGLALAGQYSEKGTPQTAEEIAVGRRLGAQIAAQLVEQIRDMGLPAERGSAGARLQINDILLWGYLLSIEEGSAEKRLAIGFRQGVSELETAVEGYQMTAQGLRKLGFGKVSSAGSKTPGTAVPLAVMLATDNPMGLIVSGAMKVGGEVSGRSTIEGRSDQTVKEIANLLKKRFEQLGWIK